MAAILDLTVAGEDGGDDKTAAEALRQMVRI